MALMSILDSRLIEFALPTLARPIMCLDVNEDAIVGALKQSLVILIMSMMQWILKMNIVLLSISFIFSPNYALESMKYSTL